MSVWVVIVAAGRGQRFGAPKQFARLGGRTLVEWSVDAARSVADGVVLVVPSGEPPDAPGGRMLRDGLEGVDAVVPGGATRSASVRAGLAAVPPVAEIIAVHDGARPLASRALFASVVDAVRAGADAAVPASALADTLKRVADGTVVTTVARDGLVTVQTPQAFRADVLRAAHDEGGDASDDAGLVEARGVIVRVVPGDPRNIKVTTTADLEIVQALAAS
jgi:2-C-methyl-D-erythritol 4-phosphate cytidylyltransferase